MLRRKKNVILISVVLASVILLLWARWRPAERLDVSALTGDEFRLVTWNVGYFAVAEDKNMRDVDIVAVAEVLSASKADVAVLQELGNLAQAEKIAEKLGKGWAAHSIPTMHGNQVVSILTPLEVTFEDSVECGGRNAIGVTLRTAEGKSIYVLGVHSPHPARGIAENKESISAALSHTRNRTEGIRIIAGDLNYNFDSEASGELYKNITQDFGDSTLSIGETYYAHTRLDHIFHYPIGLKVEDRESGMVDLPFRFAKVPGFRDHRPILVSYDLTN